MTVPAPTPNAAVTADDGEPLLAVRALRVELDGVNALDGTNLDVRRRQRVGVVGETGSGKTLTTRALIGLLSRIGAEVRGGSIRFDGEELAPASERRWRRIRGRRIALVPQSSLSGLDPLMTVGRQLAEAIRAVGSAPDVRARAEQLLASVEIDDIGRVLSSYPHQLSGGQRQRIVIALALVGEPELLVADEPTTALDVTVERGVLRLLRSLTETRGMSLVLITHNLDVVSDVCDEIVIVYAGMTVERGPTRDVLAHPAHPYTRALLAARPHLAASEELQAIPGSPPGLHDRPPGCRFAPRCGHTEARCRETVPALRAIAGGHEAACVRAEELVGAS